MTDATRHIINLEIHTHFYISLWHHHNHHHFLCVIYFKILEFCFHCVYYLFNTLFSCLKIIHLIILSCFFIGFEINYISTFSFENIRFYKVTKLNNNIEIEIDCLVAGTIVYSFYCCL